MQDRVAEWTWVESRTLSAHPHFPWSRFLPWGTDAAVQNREARFSAWITQSAGEPEYYQRKRREGKSHQMALRALANTWVRILYALWHKREAYVTETFVVAQQAHTRRAA
jgi:hypothetical protein